MKVYVTSRFKGAENKREIEALCKAVKNARLKDFNFTRDIENYEKKFDDPKELWDRARDEIGACDMLLVDVSDHPTGGRVVEAGIAYALRKPIVVVQKTGVTHKPVFDGIASKIISYQDYDDLTKQLKQYDIDRNFNVTDKTTLLIMFLLVGGVIAYGLAQISLLLASIGAIAYWLVVRHFSATMRAFDRIVVYIPLALAWWAGYGLFNMIGTTAAIGWTVGYWLLALFILSKMKFSL
jgi:nucleoside 2-deoxyribosyltransferase